MNNIEYMEAYRYGRFDEQAEFISVIDDIKAEIQNGMEMFPDGDFYISVDVLEKIIDKHISGEPQESEEQKMQNKQLECASCEYSGKIPEYRDCPDAYTEVAVHCKKYQDITKRKESNNAIRNRN